ncbi:MAG: hypothetical protein JRE23_03285 [Deltaproteobacteria bacterium]|nr:hypothetical protein [Deltaproteobacteria bacterium]
MKSNIPNGVKTLKVLKGYSTASGCRLMQTQMQKEMEERINTMVQGHTNAVEKAMLDALVKGTSVLYADQDQPDEDTLYICGVNCDGFEPTASDPLVHYKCQLVEPHCRVKGAAVRTCYKPQMIDEQTAQEVNNDPEEWEET